MQKISDQYNSNIFLYYKNINTYIFLNLFELRTYIKIYYNKYIKYIIINKFIFLNFLYYIFLNIFNKNILNTFTFEDIKFKNIIILNILKSFNMIIFLNLKQFKKVDINLLLISSNFIKFYIHYNYIKLL
jgi:hypothetical protein